MTELFVCTNHDGHWPVGVASIVFARDETHARELLDAELIGAGLKPSTESPYTLEQIFRPNGDYVPRALILNDGDY